MAIRQQYANEELVHKLRSMLNDLPTLRTRAMKKLKYWREAAIKRLLARQRELEKALLDKFERLEIDTQVFVQKIEHKRANQQRRWQTEALDYQNKNDIDRISTNLRSIREELEQSKLLLAGSMVDDDVEDVITDDSIAGKLASGTNGFHGTLSSKAPAHKTIEHDDLGSELKRVLEICTSPQRSSSSLSADEMKYGFTLAKPKVLITQKKKKKFDAHQAILVSKVKLSPLQSLDHTDQNHQTKSRQASSKSTAAIPPKRVTQTVGTPRRNSRAITNIPIQQEISSAEQNGINNDTNSNHKLFAFESFDDSIRRFQRLREIRKNLRNKYDDQTTKATDHPTVESKSVATSISFDQNESTPSNGYGSQQKLVQRVPQNVTNSMPPTPPSVKSTTSTTTATATTTTTPRKNGETRHTIFSREPVTIPIERISSVSNTQSTTLSDVVQSIDQTAKNLHSNKENNTSQDRRHRSRTLESHQIQAVDNQIYGCSPSSAKLKQNSQHRSESQKHRNHRLSFRRSSEDHQSKQLKIRKANEYYSGSTQNILNETWFDIGKEHWPNLLENGWRPTADADGVTAVAIIDSETAYASRHKQDVANEKLVDLYEQITKNEYFSLFEQLEFAYGRTINLGNEFWRFLEIDGDHHLCLYHQLNKQFIMYKPDVSLLSFPWPYDGIVDVSWSKAHNVWTVATQTQIIICNRSFSKIFQSIDITGDWPKRITTCRSSIFHTYKLPPDSIGATSTLPHFRSLNKDRPQFLLERYDYKLNSMAKHILESSTIWDIEADDLTEHLAILCDVALLIFDYQLNLLKQIEVTGFKVTTDHFGGWLIADYNASCLWQIRRNEYLKANKILHVERPWSVILDRSNWSLVTLSETQNRAKRLLFFTMKNLPSSLETVNSSLAQSQLSLSTSSSVSNPSC